MLRRAHTFRCAVAALALTLAACSQPLEAPPPPPAPADSEQAPAVGAEAPNTEFCAEVGRRVSVEDCNDLSALADEAARGSAAFNAPDPMQRGDVHTLQLAISLAPPEQQAAAGEPEDELERLRRERDAAMAEQARRQSASSSTRQQVERLRVELEQVQMQLVEEERAQREAGATEPTPRMIELRARRSDLENQIRRLDSLSAPAQPPPPSPEDVVDPLQGETQTFTPLVGRYMRAELLGNGFEITPLTDASQEVLADSVTTWSWRVVAREGGQRSLTLRTVVEGCTAQGQCYPLRSTSQNYDVTVEVGLLGQAQDFLTAAPTWLRLLAGVLTALAVLVGAWFGLRNAFRKGSA